jgi:hypothetical protein
MHDRDYTKACLERWAKWLYGANVGEISLTGRLMAGVRANVCPNWVEDMLAQRAHDAFCPLCGGKGRLKMELRAQRRARAQDAHRQTGRMGRGRTAANAGRFIRDAITSRITNASAARSGARRAGAGIQRNGRAGNPGAAARSTAVAHHVANARGWVC